MRTLFQLNNIEERILKAVHDLGCLTLEDILRLLGLPNRSRSSTRRTLWKLCGGRDYDPQQFLYRFPLPIAKIGAKERVYCLGAKAREVIVVDGSYRPIKFRYLSYSPLLHNLMLSRFMVLATAYFHTHHVYQLLETWLSYQLTRTPPRITVNTQGEDVTITVIPDAWLHIERVKDGEAFPLWLEIDRGTENRQKFQRLVRNRLTLINSPQYEQFFHTSAVLFCYVVTEETSEQGGTRLYNMRRWIEDMLSDMFSEDKQAEWASLFRFTTVSYETLYEDADRLFTQPV